VDFEIREVGGPDETGEVIEKAVVDGRAPVFAPDRGGPEPVGPVTKIMPFGSVMASSIVDNDLPQ
jgi:hypothetical protein